MIKIFCANCGFDLEVDVFSSDGRETLDGILANKFDAMCGDCMKEFEDE